MSAAIRRLMKWADMFVRRELGTRSPKDVQARALADQYQTILTLRMEVSTLTRLLVEAGVCTVNEFDEARDMEAELLNHRLETSFPGLKATDEGIVVTLPDATETIRGWLP